MKLSANNYFIKHILKEYLGNDFKETTDELINTNEQENLRKMVKAEIENCSKEKLDKLNISTTDLEKEKDKSKSESESLKLDVDNEIDSKSKPDSEPLKLDIEDIKPETDSVAS